MPSRRLLGSFENVKRKVCSHPYFGGETIKDPGQKARVHNGNEFPRIYNLNQLLTYAMGMLGLLADKAKTNHLFHRLIQNARSPFARMSGFTITN